MKVCLFGVYAVFVVLRLGRRILGDTMKSMEIRNISFHGIGMPGPEREPGEHGYWIDKDSFLRLLDECARRPQVRLSFDDGNASDVEIALPALVERGLTADFFPVADRMGTAGSVDRAGLRELVSAGMRIGTHGAAHRSWACRSAAELVEELETARRRIAEAAGCTVDSAACPFGAYDRRVLRQLRVLGYERVFTSDARPAWAGQWRQPRYTVRAGDTAETIRAKMLLPRGPAGRLADSAVLCAKGWRRP